MATIQKTLYHFLHAAFLGATLHAYCTVWGYNTSVRFIEFRSCIVLIPARVARHKTKKNSTTVMCTVEEIQYTTYTPSQTLHAPPLSCTAFTVERCILFVDGSNISAFCQLTRHKTIKSTKIAYSPDSIVNCKPPRVCQK
jgi:hypothetical protein